MKDKQTVGISMILVLLVTALLFQPAGDTLAAAPLREPQPSAQRPALPAAGSRFWSSEWLPIAQSQTITFNHNLGGDPNDYAVQLWFRDTNVGGYGIHIIGYGGLEDGGQYSGAYWWDLTASHIRVTREPNDTLVDQVRVWVWVPEVLRQNCSDWQSIAQGTAAMVDHHMAGSEDDYVVGLWFKANTPLGINQKGYGGMEAETEYYGAFWHSLDTSNVYVYRMADDSSVDQFRLCVSVGDPPDWDSGWVELTPDQGITLPHGLGSNPNRYIVRMEFNDLALTPAPAALYGINNRALGGDANNMIQQDMNHLGASWQKLTAQTIDVHRWENDTSADQIRVRIWQRNVQVYLPIVLGRGG